MNKKVIICTTAVLLAISSANTGFCIAKKALSPTAKKLTPAVHVTTLTAQAKELEIKDKQAINQTSDVKNPLGIAYAENAITKAETFIKENNFQQAKFYVNSIQDWVSDATEFHTELFKTLKKIENANAQSEIEKELAIKFAKLRDKSNLLQSKILIYEGQKRKAAEKLVEVARSQPATEIGHQAYKLLQDIGFTYPVTNEKLDTAPIQS